MLFIEYPTLLILTLPVLIDFVTKRGRQIHAILNFSHFN